MHADRNDLVRVRNGTNFESNPSLSKPAPPGLGLSDQSGGGWIGNDRKGNAEGALRSEAQAFLSVCRSQESSGDGELGMIRRLLQDVS